MPLKAIFLGSLGTLAETSELRRRALNTAFAEAGVDWSWSTEHHHRLTSGSTCYEATVAADARARGACIDAAAICQRQQVVFRDLLGQVRMPPRPGLRRLIDASRAANLRLALVTTSLSEDVDAMLSVTGFDRSDFAFVGDRHAVAAPKPAPDIYRAAMAGLSVCPQETLAVEESRECTKTAKALGIRCISFPGSVHLGPHAWTTSNGSQVVPAQAASFARSA